jgi:hypothetical protein
MLSEQTSPPMPIRQTVSVDIERDTAPGEGHMVEPRRKKQWSDLSPAQQRAIIVGGIVELIMTTIALFDLVRRPAKSVRGPKPLWLLAFFVQPFGPIFYFLVGRRRSHQ